MSKATKLPPVFGEQSVAAWEKFGKDSEPSRKVCKEVRARLDAKRVPSVARNTPPIVAAPTVKPTKKKVKRK